MIEKLQKELDNQIKTEEILANHTAFQIGGPAKYFYLAKDSAGLLKAVQAAEKINFPYVILGWGSNVLVSDAGFPGLVIKASSDNFKVNGDIISAEAGFSLNRLIGLAAKAGLAGLEYFTGIPATVGGAAAGNAGAYGVSFADKVLEVEVYQNNQIKKYNQSEMQYSYRDSYIKHSSAVILSVVLQLAKGEPKDIMAKIIEISTDRKLKLPTEPSAGCIFKNIELDQAALDPEKMCRQLDISLEEWQQATRHGKLGVGYIIDHLNLKGKTIGGVKISDKHAAFIVNTGGAKAEHVMMLISDIKMEVRNKLGIQLQEEIKYLGF